MAKGNVPEVTVGCGEGKAVFKIVSPYGSAIEWVVTVDGYNLVVYGDAYNSKGEVQDDRMFITPIAKNTVSLTM